MRIIIAANRKGKRLFQQQLQKSSAQTVPPSAQQKRGGPFASDGFFGIAAALGDFANALLREAVKSIFGFSEAFAKGFLRCDVGIRLNIGPFRRGRRREGPRGFTRCR